MTGRPTPTLTCISTATYTPDPIHTIPYYGPKICNHCGHALTLLEHQARASDFGAIACIECSLIDYYDLRIPPPPQNPDPKQTLKPVPCPACGTGLILCLKTVDSYPRPHIVCPHCNVADVFPLSQAHPSRHENPDPEDRPLRCRVCASALLLRLRTVDGVDRPHILCPYCDY